ncbi:MAG: nucleotide exchange factor GrpE [Planctomycetaceae bacterium]
MNQPADEHEIPGESTPAKENAAPRDESLAEQLEAARAERDANYDKFLRTQAELDNFRKRSRAEFDRDLLHRSAGLVRDLLPALDNLDRAIAAAETSRNVDQLAEGMKLVARQFRDVLAARQVEEIAAIGEPFDPNLHEAIQQIPSADHPHLTVLDEVEKGYKLHDHVIRPSKVVVSRKEG